MLLVFELAHMFIMARGFCYSSLLYNVPYITHLTFIPGMCVNITHVRLMATTDFYRFSDEFFRHARKLLTSTAHYTIIKHTKCSN